MLLTTEKGRTRQSEKQDEIDLSHGSLPYQEQHSQNLKSLLIVGISTKSFVKSRKSRLLGKWGQSNSAIPHPLPPLHSLQKRCPQFWQTCVNLRVLFPHLQHFNRVILAFVHSGFL